MERQGLKAEDCFALGRIPTQWQVEVRILWGQGAILETVNHPAHGCCLRFCIGQALYSYKGHLGGSLLVIRMFSLNNEKHHPGAHLFFIWSRVVEDGEVCHNYR